MKTLKHIVIILLWNFCLLPALFAQDFNVAKMDSLFSLIEKNEKGMGSFSLFKDGKEVYHNTIGYVEIDTKQKADYETKYRIGSISKTFTAVIIMQLIAENKLGFDTKLSKFFPTIKNAENITISQLLGHRSGIYNFTNAEEYTEWMEQPITKENLVKKIAGYPSAFEPGAKAEYSNSNYVLLALIAEKVDKKNFEKIFADRITKKFELKNTAIGGKINPALNEALSYTKLTGWELASETDMSVPIGAGSIISTPTDLNHFYHKLFTEKIIPDALLDSMKNQRDDYGMGLFEYPYYNEKLYGHTGGIDGFQSNSAYMPSRNVTISYVSNGVVWARNNILLGALKIYFGDEYELPNFESSSYKPSSAELRSIEGVYGAENFPLKISIRSKDGVLLVQATGQPEFPLEAVEKNKFKFEQAGVVLEFNPTENKMTLMQGGGKFELNKE